METAKKIYTFSESLKVGAQGEEIVKKFLQNMNNVHKVVDMANNNLFYHKDVDFVVEFEDRSKQMVEIKTDVYTSGNIYYETISNEGYNVDGCMEKTSAHWLLYYFITLDKLYVLKMDTYRKIMNDLIERNHPAMKKREVFNNAKTAGMTYKSIGYTLPLTVLEEMMPKGACVVYNGIQKRLDN